MLVIVRELGLGSTLTLSAHDIIYISQTELTMRGHADIAMIYIYDDIHDMKLDMMSWRHHNYITS